MHTKVFYHGCDLFKDNTIILEQVELFEKTLLDEVDEVHMMLHYQKEYFDWLVDRWKDRTNVIFHFFDETYKAWYEATTMHYIQELCHNTPYDFYVLYTHSKGATKPNSIDDFNWRHYMQYFTVEKWKECVEKLDDGYDTCGASLIAPNTHIYHANKEPFYAGNYWWATSKYLKRCERFLTPPEYNFKPQMDVNKGKSHRFDQESWHGTGMPKYYEINPNPSYNCWVLTSNTYR